MKYKVVNAHFDNGYENLDSYCEWLKRKNSAVLFKLESYTGEKLTSNSELLEMRNMILDVSNDIARIPSILFIEGDKDEGL